jgi:glutaredoxin
VRVGIATFTVVVVGTACLFGTGQGASLLPALAKILKHGSGGTEAASVEPAPAAASEPAPGHQVYYQYVDDTGAVQFAARLDQVPAQWRDRAGMIEMAGPPPMRPSDARDAREMRALNARPAAATSDEASEYDELAAQAGLGRGRGVILYGTASCVACKMVRAHLMRRGISYEERDVEYDPDAQRELLTKSGGRPGVPLVDVRGQIMQGYDSVRLDAMLGAR